LLKALQSTLDDLPDGGKDSLKKIFSILAQSSDNYGNTDETRALNYLAVRYSPVYEAYLRSCRRLTDEEAVKAGADRAYYLFGVTAVQSLLTRPSVGKHIVDVILSYQNQKNAAIQKYFISVDVSHLFPMIVTHYGPYIGR
jgi:hypothetical protein